MADREIVIRILNEKEAETKKVDSTGENQEKPTDNLDKTVSSLLIKAGKQLKGMMVSEAKYQFNMYFQMTDNYLGQQNMNIALGIADKASSMVLSIGAAMKVGSAAGPVGAAVAAAAVIVTSTISLSLQIGHNYRQERIKINQMNAELSFNRQRAGYSLTAGSIGENK